MSGPTLTMTYTPEGELKYPTRGQQIKVHYTGKLTNGTVFDSSVSRGTPFVFTLGVGQVIRLWDESFAKIPFGGKAIISGTHEYCYGERGFPPVIPPKATLTFEVECIGPAN